MKFVVTGYYTIYFFRNKITEKYTVCEIVHAENISEALMIILESMCLTVGNYPSKRWVYMFHEDIKVKEVE